MNGQRVEWKSLITERPDSKRKILCTYRGGTAQNGGWLWCVSIYYPDRHRIFVANEEWFGGKIKKRDVHWIDLPLSPEGTMASAWG
jgi:hypothetical protein